MVTVLRSSPPRIPGTKPRLAEAGTQHTGKNKINQWFKTQMKEDNIIRGRDAIDRYCKAKGINLADLSKPEFMEKVMNRYAFKDWDSVLASIGHGGLKEGQVINKMLEEGEEAET